MADPLSIASGLVALAGFAFQSSKLLYQAVDSFQSNKKIVRELREEIEALEGVLQSLNETVTKTEAGLTTLKLPLLRLGKACTDFETLIAKCTAHSRGPRTSFRDWAKLTYMGDDIVGFKDVLAGYKSTIVIALSDANMRTSTVTAAVVKEYKELVTNTTSDLEDHLQRINDKLQNLSLQDTIISDNDAAERQQIQEERDSTRKCLDICAQAYTHMDKFQLGAEENTSLPSGTNGRPTTLDSLPPARLITIDTFKVCKEKLTSATTQLETQLRDIDNRLQNLSSPPPNSTSEQAIEQKKMQEEIESIRQCLAICGQASRQADQTRINIFEDISMADDGQQVIISTIGDLISAKRVTAGARSLQVMGQLSDDSVQHLSRDHGGTHAKKATELQEPQVGDAQFENRYGTGIKLNLPKPENRRSDV